MNNAPIIIGTVTNDLSYDQRMIRISTSLVRAGYRVQLVGRRQKASKPFEYQQFEQKRLFCFFGKGKLFYIEYNIRLFLYLMFKKYDVVCTVDLDTILPGLIISRLRRKKVIYDAHEYFTETPEVERRPVVKKVWETLADFAVPRVHAAYTVGEGLAEIFEKRYGKSFSVIRNVPFHQPDIAEPSQNIILYQGALNEGRGLEQVIMAMQYLENAVLWLAGEGDLSRQLRQQVADYQLETKVKFWGYLLPVELKQVTLQAKIGLNLLENRGLSYYYSLANKAFDYIQAGIPSMHMNFPEYQKINKKWQVFMLLDDLKVESIVESIKRLLFDAQFYNQLRKNCLKAKQTFIWEKEEGVLLDVYNKVVTKN